MLIHCHPCHQTNVLLLLPCHLIHYLAYKMPNCRTPSYPRYTTHCHSSQRFHLIRYGITFPFIDLSNCGNNCWLQIAHCIASTPQGHWNQLLLCPSFRHLPGTRHYASVIMCLQLGTRGWRKHCRSYCTYWVNMAKDVEQYCRIVWHANNLRSACPIAECSNWSAMADGRCWHTAS